MSTACPVRGCDARRRIGELLCPEHWRLVPYEIKADIWRRWRDLRHQRGLPADMRQQQLDAYFETRRRAIEIVEAALADRQPS